MNVFNKRNALVGFVTLKAMQRAMKRRRRWQRFGRGPKIAAFVLLGIVSLGVLAGVAAVFLRKRGQESQRLEGYAVADDVVEAGAETEEPSPEPIPAT